MNNNLIIFQEKHYSFGLFPEDFEKHLSLDQVWVRPSGISPSIWNFEAKKKDLQGVFVHLGVLFGFPMNSFHHSGYVFIKELPDLSFGVLMGNYQLKIPTQSIGNTKVGIDEIADLPSNIPKSAFRYAVRYKKRKILIIDPLMLLRSYNNLFPVNI